MKILPISLSSLVLAALLSLAAGCTQSTEPADPAVSAADEMDTLVTAAWLAEHLDDPNLVVLDCTVVIEEAADGGLKAVSGRSRYEAGHIPTAGFADLTGDLADGSSALQFALPAAEHFAATMAALGVDDASRVVLYDASGSAWAARVWWMLRWIGFDRAALLDGGLGTWLAEGRPLSTEPLARSPGSLTINLRPELIADRDEVLAAIDDEAVTLIDALPEAHYRGEMTMYPRPGHIPGAVNVPMFSLLTEDGRFRGGEELAALFDSGREARAITYCGGGIAASANAFIMTRLGFEDVAVYAASLQEWAADPENPMLVGDDSPVMDP